MSNLDLTLLGYRCVKYSAQHMVALSSSMFDEPDVIEFVQCTDESSLDLQPPIFQFFCLLLFLVSWSLALCILITMYISLAFLVAPAMARRRPWCAGCSGSGGISIVTRELVRLLVSSLSFENYCEGLEPIVYVDHLPGFKVPSE